jgi:hypothetical protein
VANLTIIGTLGLNFYEGKLTKQVYIKDARIDGTTQN